ncbi:MAG TPA: alpha/beta hydrolase [Atribacterota bacterium]|nr:alpha/beta hydrolase [Atribacterota bacterium]
MNKKIFYILFLIVLLLLSTISTTVSAQQISDGMQEILTIEGIWEGKLKVPGAELRIVAHIAITPEGTFSATLDSPDQGVTGIPVDEIVFKDKSVHMEIKLIGGIFEGKLNEEFTMVDGTWQQAGFSFPLSFHRVEEAVEIKRPQEPEKPYPYTEEEVKYVNPSVNITLAGTLTLPEGQGPFPAAILISGSGPQDRDEFLLGHRPFLVLADYLTRKGIAVLRFDDRGVGESTGDFMAATSEDFATDVEAGIAYLKTRSEIDPQQIGLIGHSEGGLIAPVVAVQLPEVTFIVLMAGPGLTGKEIVLLQSALISRATGVSEEDIALSLEYNKKFFTLIKEENNKEILAEELQKLFYDYFNQISQEEKEKIGEPDLYIHAQLQSLLSPWFKHFLTYDPKPALSKVKCPVLAINGEKDLQVPPVENLKAIEEALLRGGNRDFMVKELPGLNHLFQTAQTGSPEEYALIEETIAPIALKLMSDWILAHVQLN